MIHFFLGIHAFVVVPKENNFEGFLGGKLNLEWEIKNIPSGYTISKADLFYNTSLISKLNVGNNPALLPKAEQLFQNRIAITLTGSIYQVALTDLLFNDTGIFIFVVHISEDKPFAQPIISGANITISSVIGECRFPYS